MNVITWYMSCVFAMQMIKKAREKAEEDTQKLKLKVQPHSFRSLSIPLLFDQDLVILHLPSVLYSRQ